MADSVFTFFLTNKLHKLTFCMINSIFMADSAARFFLSTMNNEVESAFITQNG